MPSSVIAAITTWAASLTVSQVVAAVARAVIGAGISSTIRRKP